MSDEKNYDNTVIKPLIFTDEKTTTGKLFECENGGKYILSEKNCAFCKHCTDLFYDSTNGPYAFICELKSKSHKHCFYNGKCYFEEE